MEECWDCGEEYNLSFYESVCPRCGADWFDDEEEEEEDAFV